MEIEEAQEGRLSCAGSAYSRAVPASGSAFGRFAIPPDSCPPAWVARYAGTAGGSGRTAPDPNIHSRESSLLIYSSLDREEFLFFILSVLAVILD